MSNIYFLLILLFVLGLTEGRTRVGGFKVLSDNQLHYKTASIFIYFFFTYFSAYCYLI